MKKIAIIPARGGSKRVPRKNIKVFMGKPIISYSIETAIKSKLFDEVMVSTDDREIALIAKEYGANVPFMRSMDNANDIATTSDVLIEVIEKYKSELGNRYDVICCIYPTAPFITAAFLKNSFKQFNNEGADTLISVKKYSSPPQRAFVFRRDQFIHISPEYRDIRSQDLEPYYHDAGMFYWLDVEVFCKYKNFTHGRVLPFILNEMESQDIDSKEDWALAEFKYQVLNSAK